MRKLITKWTIKHKPWCFVSYACRIPFMTKLVQYVYYNYFSGPKSVKIHINSECNYNCVYCYSDNLKGKVLQTGEWLEFINQLRPYDIQTVEISGGEPLLHKDILRILNLCSNQGYQITIYTNGSLINEEWIKKIKSLNTKTIISVKYDCVESYRRNTKGKQDIKKIEEKIKLLVSNKIPVVTFITVTKESVKHIEEILNRAIELGAFPVVERYIPVKDNKINTKLSIKDEDWLYVIGLIRRVYSNYRDLIDGVNRIQGNICSCYATQFSVMQNGNVIPCQFLPAFMSVGNILSDSIEDIWIRFKNKRNEWLKIPKECNSCNNKFICRGGCRTSAYYAYGNFSKKDPLCRSNIPTTFGHAAFIIIHKYRGLNNNQLNKV